MSERMTKKRAMFLYNAAGRGTDEWESEWDHRLNAGADEDSPEMVATWARIEEARKAQTIFYQRYIAGTGDDK